MNNNLPGTQGPRDASPVSNSCLKHELAPYFSGSLQQGQLISFIRHLILRDRNLASRKALNCLAPNDPLATTCLIPIHLNKISSRLTETSGS